MTRLEEGGWRSGAAGSWSWKAQMAGASEECDWMKEAEDALQ
jgi:hypothetical protein